MPRPKRHCVRWGPSPLCKNGAEPPIFNPCLLWPNGWMDQDATWYGGRPRPRPRCARWGPSSPDPPRGTAPPNFRPISVEVGLSQGHIVLHGTQLPLPKSGHSPQFLAHVCCGQTAGWIKMPLGIEVGLGPCHIVLDGDPAPLTPKGA